MCLLTIDVASRSAEFTSRGIHMKEHVGFSHRLFFIRTTTKCQQTGASILEFGSIHPHVKTPSTTVSQSSTNPKAKSIRLHTNNASTISMSFFDRFSPPLLLSQPPKKKTTLPVLPMLVSERLSIGQITFILRAAIQILTCDGLFLITYIILANSPRVASFRTHDTVEALRGKNTDPIPEAPAYGHFAVAFTRNLLQYQQAIIHHFEKFCNNCHNQRFHGQWNTTAVKAYRYDYAEEVRINANITERIC
ncbi:hypothetical protein Moror_10815 [Moniliophthora roreri MCA 2997]|uniref:Uncharacterized protein n=1 Tax=Moniliophthora roreri (strain MCA 2997) TaxID=1381753 RepID=V2X6A5_MONRO|nr:hypothetical protein Moror_10815 [Moniliophthora roreri MCA 2997]